MLRTGSLLLQLLLFLVLAILPDDVLAGPEKIIIAKNAHGKFKLPPAALGNFFQSSRISGYRRVSASNQHAARRRVFIVQCCGSYSCSVNLSNKTVPAHTSAPKQVPANDPPTTMATDVTDVATDATAEESCVPKYVTSKPACTIDYHFPWVFPVLCVDGYISLAGLPSNVVQKTREDAEKTCCSLGMTLVSMDDATKSQCLADYYKSLAFMPTTFWTSGADVGCPGQWTWSNTAQTFAPGIKWAPGQPNGTGMCVESAMSVEPPATLLYVKTCASTNKFICQKAALEPATTTTPAPREYTFTFYYD
ncbi:hypothetical protein B566_EDAN002248 [Ephemera danica]|nr:hypothetical protein B566_EDAN002248 [Ephemera danica]